MAMYLTRFSYTPETWARMIENPEDRREAARSYIESVAESSMASGTPSESMMVGICGRRLITYRWRPSHWRSAQEARSAPWRPLSFSASRIRSKPWKRRSRYAIVHRQHRRRPTASHPRRDERFALLVPAQAFCELRQRHDRLSFRQIQGLSDR